MAGQEEKPLTSIQNQYDPKCYLCPGNSKELMRPKTPL